MDAGESAVGPSSHNPRLVGRPSEVVVRGGRGWKSLLKRKASDGTHQHRGGTDPALENARQILDACRGDIVALWTSGSVQAGLREEGVVLREQSGLCVIRLVRFFLIACAHQVLSLQFPRPGRADSKP